jgi:hypothetical protein
MQSSFFIRVYLLFILGDFFKDIHIYLFILQNSFFKGSSKELVSTVEEKITMLKKLPEEVLNLWDNWKIRGTVLLGLLLQGRLCQINIFFFKKIRC